jgi:hypothetical protein
MPVVHVNVWESFRKEKTKIVIENITKVFARAPMEAHESPEFRMSTYGNDASLFGKKPTSGTSVPSGPYNLTLLTLIVTTAAVDEYSALLRALNYSKTTSMDKGEGLDCMHAARVQDRFNQFLLTEIYLISVLA